MVTVTIDGIEGEVEPGMTILQAAEQLGVEIPRFCYHERLSIAGNCRMCLVRLEKGPPKPVASCAMPVAEGMVVHTNTPEVEADRAGVMEFLLINHPLDCPICDQGGECDLQDQAMAYGRDRSRFKENKRAVKEKNMGPLIKTIMTRCIQCTRCVRFMDEVAGVPVLGAVARGENMEIATYLEQGIASELSGNIVDLCPVGALTNGPYAFTARSWELKKTESIDVLDAVGSNIRVDSRSGAVMRILPRLNEDVNEEWLDDKGRQSCDGLKYQRLDQPFVRVRGKLKPASWEEALAAAGKALKKADPNKIVAVAGDQADAETLLLAKNLLGELGATGTDCAQDGQKVDASVRASYLFNTTIAGIEDADALLIIGADPRREAPVLNARIRKRYLAGGFKVGVIGTATDLTYKTTHLGDNADVLTGLASGSGEFFDVLKNAERPMIIVGTGALAREDGGAILAAAKKLADGVGAVTEDFNGFNVLQTAASRVGALDLGFVPGEGAMGVAEALQGNAEVVWLLGADELDTQKLGDAFVIYQGHHGDAGAHRADVILPGAAYTEKTGTYVNTEGRVQRTAQAIFPPGEAKEDWAIVRALSGVALKKPLPVNSLVQAQAALAEANAVFANVDEITPATWGDFGAAGDIAATELSSPILNYYMTDPISRASRTMAECSREFVTGEEKATGTDG